MENPSIVSHLSIGTARLEAAAEFYDRVLDTFGCRRIMEFPGGVAYGRAFPEFWIQTPMNGAPASSGNGFHVAFIATSHAQVDAFHAAALAAGGTDDGPPGPRPAYGPTYYAAYVRDLDGHKIEATYVEE